MNYNPEKHVAITAALAAAQLCERVRCNRSPHAIEKQDRSPVTIADFGTQALLCRAISQAFPTDPIIAEESAALLRQPQMAEQLQQVTQAVQALVPDTTPDAVLDWIDRGNGQVSDRFWTLDPIDGTKGFLRGDQYAIALALVEAGEVKLGVMACPALPVNLTQPEGDRGVIFVAVRGQGSSRIAMGTGQTEAIQVRRTLSSQSEYLRLLESVERDRGNPALQRAIAQSIGVTAPCLKMDSLAKYGVLAQGEAALYLRLPWIQEPDYRENIWDHAAGAIVVEEAGGRVTDMDGKRLDYSTGAKLIHNRGIIASNGTLHEAVLAALRQRVLVS